MQSLFSCPLSMLKRTEVTAKLGPGGSHAVKVEVWVKKRKQASTMLPALLTMFKGIPCGK